MSGRGEIRQAEPCAMAGLTVTPEAALARDRRALADLAICAERSARRLTLGQVDARRSNILTSELNREGGKPHG